MKSISRQLAVDLGDRMKSRIIATTSLAVAVIVPVLGFASPANAVTCTSGVRYTAPAVSNSASFYATSTCDGAYAGTAAARGDWVRGRFHKGGVWETSTYGYVWVSAASDGWDKVIGNMVTGREARGQSQNYGQNVSYLY